MAEEYLEVTEIGSASSIAADAEIYIKTGGSFRKAALADVLAALSPDAGDVALADGSGRTLSGFLSTAVTDLDDAAYTGFYPYASTAANKPGNNGGIVFAVRASANYIHQLAFMNYPQAVDADVVYYRRCYAGSWTGWRNVSMS